MKVLQINNQYFSGLGGEDTVVRLENELLRGHGHEVRQLIISTSKLRDANPLRLLQAAVSSAWSGDSYESVANEVKAFRPDVVHVHNTFPLLSPSVYYAARRNGACVVQTIHNFRIACANGLLLRNGSPCEDCVGRAKWRGLMHRCYHGSASISGSVVALQTVHRVAGTYRREVDAYIALTSFQRDILIRDGLPAERIHVKPNFSPGAIAANGRSARKLQIAFIGNIRRLKGIDLLLDAWTRVRPEGYCLLLLGEGPDRAQLERQYASDDSIVWMGLQSTTGVTKALADSKYIVIASRWYECFPMVLLEAFSAGTPAIAPRHAAFPEMLEGGKCGFLFEPSNVDALARALRLGVAIRGRKWRDQSNAATRRAAEYGPDANYVRMMEVYAAAQAHYAKNMEALVGGGEHSGVDVAETREP
jgi:glycosyltransferase involved in cell wall biosynthesis